MIWSEEREEEAIIKDEQGNGDVQAEEKAVENAQGEPEEAGAVKPSDKGEKEEDVPATEEKPAVEKAKEEEAPAAEEKPAVEEAKEEEAPVAEEKKGDANQSKSTEPQNPTECANCAKALKKKLWYYRNSAFYCNKKCYIRKVEADKKKAEEQKSGH